MPERNPFSSIISVVLLGIILFIPLFFIPVFRDFLVTSKLYLLFYGMLIVFGLAFIYTVTTKQIVIHKNPFSAALILILISVVLSIWFMSPNSVMALLSPRFGFLMIAALGLFFLFTTQLFESKKTTIITLLTTSATLVSFVSIILAIRPLRSMDLGFFSFLNDPTFNLIGSSIDLIIFLGLVLVFNIVKILNLKEDEEEKTKKTKPELKNGIHYKSYSAHPLYYFSFIIIFVALCIHVYFVIKGLYFDDNSIVMTPWGLSWFAAIEVLKSPYTAIFGAGIGNFSSLFTQVKNVAYNLSDFWQITTFTGSRSAVLHIISEAGLLALTGFALVFFKVFETFRLASLPARIVILYVSISLVLWPASVIQFFVFFLGLAYYAYDINKHDVADTYVFDLKKVFPLYLTTIVIAVLTLGFAGLFVTYGFISEYLFGRSIQAVQNNNIESLYNNQRAAIGFNPYNEDFRRDFAQTNLLIANNIASQEQEEITDQDRQNITQAVQASIDEAKAAVSLNPESAVNWQHLANIYRNIINLAGGAGEWTVVSYQRAILLDPQNPSLRVDLGGVLYAAENYEQSERLFEQAVNLKPDWPNAYYNLAWSRYQQGSYQEAAFAMQQVLSLLNPEEDKEDFDQAQEDLNTFLAEIEELEQEQPPDGSLEDETEEEAQDEESELSLPEEQDEDEQIIDLPEGAAPPEEGEEEDIDINPADEDTEETNTEEDDSNTNTEDEDESTGTAETPTPDDQQ